MDGHTLNPGDNPWDEVAELGSLSVYDRTPPSELLARTRDAEIVLTNKTPLCRDTLSELPRLRLISVLATGYDVVDCRAAEELGITVCNVPGYAADSVAQHVFALLLGLLGRVAEHDRLVRSGAWRESGEFSFWQAAPVELRGKTMGIVGLGEIGSKVATIARAFGMRVFTASAPGRKSPGAETTPSARVERVELGPLLEQSDVVSLHCPLTEVTRGFVDAALLARMKRGALLINTARGALVKDCDLAEALHTGQLGGAALDVVSSEPIADDNPLLEAPHCLITPHMAWASLAARRRRMQQTAGNIRAFVRGEPINVVS